MTTIRKKAWLEAITAPEYAGKEVDPTHDGTNPVHVNTYVAEWIEFTEESGDYDLLILQAYREAFDGWTEGLFEFMDLRLRRTLKEHLRIRGIYLPNGTDRQTMASKQLESLSKQSKCPIWPTEELEMMQQKLGFMTMQSSWAPTPLPSSVTATEAPAVPPGPQISITPTAEFSPASTTGNTTVARMLMTLTKLYGGDDLKFGGHFYDVLDAKLRIFYELCDNAGISPGHYHVAYSTMLKDKARDFYYQHLSRRELTFEEMITKTRSYFHCRENNQLYLNEWGALSLEDVVTANPDKNLSWCLESVITKLQKLHQGLVYNCEISEGSLAGQLVFACQGIKACTPVLTRPASTFEGVASELRIAVGTWMRCHPSNPRARIYNSENRRYAKQKHNNHPDNGADNEFDAHF